MRVTQCISPPVCDRPQFQASAKAEQMSMHELLEAAHQMSEGKLLQHCGNGCNILTLRVGDFENTNYVMGIIYPDRFNASLMKEPNFSWVPNRSVREDIEEKLNKAGFTEYRALHAMLDASCRPGGLIFDVGIKDNLFPWRTWASESGRVILIGDSAHAR
jgi:hypothetical protein